MSNLKQENGEMTKEQLDHKSDINNPNNPQHKDRLANQSDQLNPNNWKYHKVRESNEK